MGVQAVIGDVIVTSDHPSASDGVALVIARLFTGHRWLDESDQWPLTIEMETRDGERIKYTVVSVAAPP